MTQSSRAGIPGPSAHSASVNLDMLGSPRFVVTVDTEEEFDWGAPFARDGHGMQHMHAVPRFQQMCADHGVNPCYLIDYPVTQDDFSVDLLGGYAANGTAEIGVQLHPWVNPPFDEEVNTRNSFACNLPEGLERAKLTQLYDTIVDKLKIRPDSYRAGRYGAGKLTPAILEQLGIGIDTSARARFDYSAEGGPDYSGHPVQPYWLREGQLLELPVTTVFAGALHSRGDVWFRQFASETSRSMLARSGMLERIALTPEGIPLAKAIEGIDLALEERVPIINLSFHSPSLAPGFTPYVRDADDLALLYGWWEGVFAHLRRRGVRPVTMAKIRQAASAGWKAAPIAA